MHFHGHNQVKLLFPTSMNFSSKHQPLNSLLVAGRHSLQGKIPSNTSATYQALDPTGQARVPGQGRSLTGQDEAGQGRSPGQVWEQGKAEASQKASEVKEQASRGLEQAKDSLKAASGR